MYFLKLYMMIMITTYFVEYSQGFKSDLYHPDTQNKNSFSDSDKTSLKSENWKSIKSTGNMNVARLTVGDAVKLMCQAPVTHGNMIWERSDLIYPLAVSGNRFSPDERIEVSQLAHNVGELVIRNATIDDSGHYHCRTSFRRQHHPECVAAQNDCLNQPEKVEKVFRVIVGRKKEGEEEEEEEKHNVQVDVPNRQPKLPPTKVTVLGPQLTFFGMPLELICRANFSSPDAKRDPSIELEWYHNAVLRRPSSTQSGGTYVTSRWVDSNYLESRILITWASYKDSGKWYCVDRSVLRRFQQNQRAKQSREQQRTQNNSNQPIIEDNSKSWGSTPQIPYDTLTVQVIGLSEREYNDESPTPLVAIATHLTATSKNRNNQSDDSLPNAAKLKRYPNLSASSFTNRYKEKGSSGANTIMHPCLFLLLSRLFA